MIGFQFLKFKTQREEREISREYKGEKKKIWGTGKFKGPPAFAS